MTATSRCLTAGVCAPGMQTQQACEQQEPAASDVTVGLTTWQTQPGGYEECDQGSDACMLTLFMA
jgi:hypothetical protein